jgi:predicted nucleic acid-binding protein
MVIQSNATGEVMPKLKVYLDNCAYNRPFDDQNDIRIRLESEAKLFIQEQIKDNRIDLVWSSVNDYENNDNPSPEKRERILAWKNVAARRYALNEAVLQKAPELQSLEIRAKDALHIAAAINSGCDFFITTDDEILKYKTTKLRIIDPVQFVQIWEEKENE